ncbi:MAG: SulP family inorganic anion transporter [Anaerolineales bacterium]|nr:SulP family inorganic anion transporter [Anaerolineales bacterium]
MKLIAEWLALLRREFSAYNFLTLQKDLLAGLTVAAVALPLALAFGVASGADAAAGLITAILAGILIGFLGGSPFQISGPTGAMSAVLIVLASRYGLSGVFVAGLLSGLILVLLGIFRLGRIVALIPAPVISGFTSGIAVIIALGQIDNALGIKSPPAETVIARLSYLFSNPPQPNGYALALTLVVILVMVIWPRLSWAARVPGSLAAIVIATLLVTLAGWDVPLIGSIPRSIMLENRLSWAAIPWADIDQLIVPALSIAALGAIESLLCGAVVGNMTGIRLHNSVELVAQGIGNMIIPFFGGVPATAAIARTSVNVKSGGVTRLTAILHGLILLLVALVAAPLIGRVPLAALAGVLLITAWRMNEWHAMRIFFGRRLKHAMVGFLVTLAATVLFDLTQAILIGFAVSTIIFMLQISELQVARQPVDPERLKQNGAAFTHPDYPISIYYLSGPLFFAAARKLLEAIEAQDGKEARIILSMRGIPLLDATGLEVLREIHHRQGPGGLLLTGLQPRVEAILQRAGFLAELGENAIFWSSDQAILSLDGTPPHLRPVAAPDAIEPVITPHEERTDMQL